MERYRIIYTWKVLEGPVPNCGIEQIQKSKLELQTEDVEFHQENSSKEHKAFK